MWPMHTQCTYWQNTQHNSSFVILYKKNRFKKKKNCCKNRNKKNRKSKGTKKKNESHLQYVAVVLQCVIVFSPWFAPILPQLSTFCHYLLEWSFFFRTLAKSPNRIVAFSLSLSLSLCSTARRFTPTEPATLCKR